MFQRCVPFALRYKRRVVCLAPGCTAFAPRRMHKVVHFGTQALGFGIEVRGFCAEA